MKLNMTMRVAACAVAFVAISAFGTELTHRWSFNGDWTDSAGGRGRWSRPVRVAFRDQHSRIADAKKLGTVTACRGNCPQLDSNSENAITA